MAGGPVPLHPPPELPRRRRRDRSRCRWSTAPGSPRSSRAHRQRAPPARPHPPRRGGARRAPATTTRASATGRASCPEPRRDRGERRRRAPRSSPGIAAVAREHLGHDRRRCRLAARLVEDLGFDSIHLLTLAAEVENRFRVALDPEDDAAIETVGDLVDRLEQQARRRQRRSARGHAFSAARHAAAAARPRAAPISTAGVRLAGAARARDVSSPGPRSRSGAPRVAGGLARLGVAPGDRVGAGLSDVDRVLRRLLRRAPRPARCRCRSTRRCGSGGSSEYHGRTAAMLDAVEARILLADRRVRSLLGETLAMRRPAPSPSAASLDELPRAAPLRGDGRTRRPRPRPVLVGHHGRAEAGGAHPPRCSPRSRLLNALWPDARAPRRPADAASPGCRSTTTWGSSAACFAALERPRRSTLLPPEAFVARPALWLRAISRHRAHDLAGAELRLRARHRAHRATTSSTASTCRRWRGRALRRRDGGAGGAPRLRRALRALGLPRRGADAGLRPLRGGARRHLPAARPALRIRLLRSRRASPTEARRSRSRRRRAVAGGDASWRRWREPRRARSRSPRSAGRSPASRSSSATSGARASPRDRSDGSGSAGPSLMRGYLGPARGDRRARCVDGWLDTGDLGFLQDGELYLDRPRQGHDPPARPQLRSGRSRAGGRTRSPRRAPAARWR